MSDNLYDPKEHEHDFTPRDYRIYKSVFESGHLIQGHPKCGVQHGHSYHLSVFFESDLANWQDFADLKTLVDNYVQVRLDHHFLGNASAEQISQDIANYLSDEGYEGWLELFETEKFGVIRHFFKHARNQ